MAQAGWCPIRSSTCQHESKSLLLGIFDAHLQLNRYRTELFAVREQVLASSCLKARVV